MYNYVKKTTKKTINLVNFFLEANNRIDQKNCQEIVLTKVATNYFYAILSVRMSFRLIQAIRVLKLSY